MFHTVGLQKTDSPKALAALGLKLKRKSGSYSFQQPCAAFCGTHCAIYLSRPERCRLFVCQQLKRVEAGEISEAEASVRIREAREKVAKLSELLAQAGRTNLKRPLSKRFEKAIAEPLDETSDAAAIELRASLERSMYELEAMLDRDFRLHPLRLAEILMKKNL